MILVVVAMAILAAAVFIYFEARHEEPLPSRESQIVVPEAEDWEWPPRKDVDD